MKTVPGLIMIANAALFVFGAVQHLGVAVGPFHEPRILPAAIVETMCAIADGRAVVHTLLSLLFHNTHLQFPLTCGLLSGVVPPPLGPGPPPATSLPSHHAGPDRAILGILFFARSALQQRR